MSKKMMVGLLVVLLAIASIVGVVLIKMHANSCTVGASGYAANITFSGPDANKICSNFKEYGIQDSDGLTTTGSALLFYDVSNPQGTQLCAGTTQIEDVLAQPRIPVRTGIPTYPLVSANFIVRDSGAPMLVGNYLCSYLLQAGGG